MKRKIDRRRQFWQKRALGGYGSYGTGTKATLSIGAKAGLNYAGWHEGEPIDPTALIASVIRRRGQQVGKQNVNLSAIDMTGRYKGVPEKSVQVGMIWVPSDKESTPAAFFRNIKQLAQRVAGDLAQREIIVEWDAPKRRGRVDTASPVKAPAPTTDKFCKWVREHSRRARTDPNDDCYVPPKRGRK